MDFMNFRLYELLTLWTMTTYPLLFGVTQNPAEIFRNIRRVCDSNAGNTPKIIKVTGKNAHGANTKIISPADSFRLRRARLRLKSPNSLFNLGKSIIILVISGKLYEITVS